MSEPSQQPSQQARRAAALWITGETKCATIGELREELAQTIERETGVGEAIELIKRAESVLTYHAISASLKADIATFLSNHQP